MSMSSIEKEQFIDIVSQIIMNGDNEDMSYEEMAREIWMWLISIKIKIKE